MEALLHYVWRHRLFTPGPLFTTDGREVEVLAVGVPNRDAGPDFFNAQLRIGGTLWAGNVEMHIKASGWQQHAHSADPAYNNTILHVVSQADADAVTADGRRLPVLVLPVPEELKKNYAELLHTADYPRCHAVIPSLPAIMVHSWMNALLVERIGMRAEQVQHRADLCGGDWERAFFITLARNFGFGKNGDAFEQWALRLPIAAAAHHRDNLEQVEALFLGSAGLLSPDFLPRAHRDAGVADPHFALLQREYAYLCHKYSLPAALDGSVWKFLRLRPQIFPHIKLAQLAALFHDSRAMLSRMVEIAMRGEVQDVVAALGEELRMPVSRYWQHHYIFGLGSPHSLKRLSESSIRLITINTIVPVLWAYAAHTQRPELQQRAMSLLEQLPPELNYIMRQWQDCGVAAANAADSQALVHLKRTRCDTYDCLHCRFGYQYLKQK